MAGLTCHVADLGRWTATAGVPFRMGRLEPSNLRLGEGDLQTLRFTFEGFARRLVVAKLGGKMCQVAGYTCHVAVYTCHVAGYTCHVAGYTCHVADLGRRTAAAGVLLRHGRPEPSNLRFDEGDLQTLRYTFEASRG